MSAAKKWPPGYRALDDVVQEYGRDHAQTKLISGEWPAFQVHTNTGDVEPIPATTWCVARGRTWLEAGSSEWVELRRGGTFEMISYAVIVRVSERQPRRQRKAPQADRIKPAIAQCFPNGTGGISTKAIHNAVVDVLAPDSRKRGLADPSETSVKRVLDRRK